MKKKVNISIDKNILDDFEEYCENEQIDLSEIIEEMMEEILKINSNENEN